MDKRLWAALDEIKSPLLKLFLKVLLFIIFVGIPALFVQQMLAKNETIRTLRDTGVEKDSTIRRLVRRAERAESKLAECNEKILTIVTAQNERLEQRLEKREEIESALKQAKK